MSVRSSVHPCLLSCLSLSVPGSGTAGGIGRSCRGGRSSKRPTQFQPGSQLLLVLRRSAENERREKRAACVRGAAAVVCASAVTLPPYLPSPLWSRLPFVNWVNSFLQLRRATREFFDEEYARGTNVVSVVGDAVSTRVHGSQTRGLPSAQSIAQHRVTPEYPSVRDSLTDRVAHPSLECPALGGYVLNVK